MILKFSREEIESSNNYTSFNRMVSSDDPNEIKLIPCKVYNVLTLIKKSETANGSMEDIKSIKVGSNSIEPKIINADIGSYNIFDNADSILITISMYREIKDLEIEYITKHEIRDKRINEILKN